VKDHLLSEGALYLSKELIADPGLSVEDAKLLEKNCTLDTLLAVEARLCFAKALRASGFEPRLIDVLIKGDGAARDVGSLFHLVKHREANPDKKEYVCIGVDSGERLYVGIESGEFREASVVAV